MFPLFKIITSQQKRCHTAQNTANPSGNNALKFSAEVSKVHVAARVKGPEAADVKLASRRFNDFFRPRHGLRSLLPFVQAAQ